MADNPFGAPPEPRRQTQIRKTPIARMKMRGWSDEIDFKPLEIDEEGQDRLAIPKEIIENIQADDGVVLQWVTRSVFGQEQPTHTARFEKNYWTPVHQSDFGGVLDGRFCPKGRDCQIEVDGLVLMARPKPVDDRARIRDSRQASAPLEVKRQQMLGGDMPNVVGSDHPSALASNRIRRTVESVAIPDDV